MGVAAVPLAIMAAAQAAKSYNTYKTAKKQDKILARGISQQADLERQNAARAQQELAKIEAGMGEGESGFQQRYNKQLQLKQAEAMAGLMGERGDISEAGEEKQAASAAGAGDYGGLFSSLFAGLDAPAEKRLQEGISRLGMGTEFQTTRREAAAADYLARLKAAGVRRNPWIDLAAGIGQGVAGGMMMGGAPTGPATIAGSGGQTPQQFFAAPSLPNMPPQMPGYSIGPFGSGG